MGSEEEVMTTLLPREVQLYSKIINYETEIF